MPLQAFATKPSHTDIQNTINLVKPLINSLYKDGYDETGSSYRAVLAEYPSFPFMVEYNTGKRIRVGEDTYAEYTSWRSTEVYDVVESGSRNVEYKLRFRTGEYGMLSHNIPTLKIQIYYGNSYTKITVTHLAWSNHPYVSYADIYFGDRYVGRASSSTVGNSWTIYIYNYSQPHDDFRAHRYIERHGAQLGYLWYLANGDSSKANEIANWLSYRGYTLKKDIYAPMFGEGSNFAQNYLYESGSSGVYRDCYDEPPMYALSYQYHSKVCTIGVDNYIVISREQDWLVPTLWAIHLLNKGVNPDQDRWDGSYWRSARDIARMVESKWIADYGVRSPYSSTHASGVRTAAFLVLETILGYGYGDNTSKTYADKAANALLNPQVKNGYVYRENEDGSTSTLYRPQYKGGFYTAWNGYNYVAKKSILQQIADMFNQPDEHADIKPTNTETSITIAQALRVYDCYVYGYNCSYTP